MADLIRLPIRLIRLDFQPEENLIQETVEEFTALLRGGHSFPPITVYFDGEIYWLFDGFHRLRASRKLRRRTIEAEVVLGTYADMDAEWKKGLEAVKADLRAWAETEAAKARVK
jgi:hypothetical protein